jgi:hypothetical protein
LDAITVAGIKYIQTLTKIQLHLRIVFYKGGIFGRSFFYLMKSNASHLTVKFSFAVRHEIGFKIGVVIFWSF